MPLPARSRARRALVGSAVTVGDRSEHQSGYAERRAMPWQERALRVVDLIPELDYVSHFYARMLKQLRLYPATREPNGELTEIEDGDPVDVLGRIHDAGGGMSQILANHGKLAFITGEGNLFGYDLDTEDETWTYVWNEELSVERAEDNTIRKIIWAPSASGDKREFSNQEAIVYKFWTPHPRRTGEATSPMRAIVEGDVAEELIALTRSVRSTATSRAVRGILIMPQEISPPPIGPDGDENPEVSPWLSLIAEHLEAQIDQAGSAAAASPYLMEVPYDYSDRIRVLELHNPQHDYLERDLRNEAVERIARGVDFPPEALLGIGRTNHWAALQILLDMWRSHGAPVAQQFCDDLTSVYLRPALREAGYADWRSVVVAYDESRVTVKPDRSGDARTALQLGAIGPSGFRKMLDIPEDYAPTEDELAQQEPAPQQQQAPQDPNRDPVANGPQQPGPEGDSGRRSRVTTDHTGVIELALMRCRELAGIRIKQKTQRQYPERLEFIQSIPFADIAAVLGTETLAELGLNDSISLVAGGADNLRSLLKVWGYSKEQADIFGKQVEMHAARTLHELAWPEDFADLAEQLLVAA